MSKLVSYTEALAILRDAAVLQPTETVRLSLLAGRVTAETISAQIDVPSFHNSAMDGFALVAADTQGATPENPVILSIAACLAAGDSASTTSATQAISGTAVEIMTGAPVPEGYDAVIMVEKANPQHDAEGKTISIRVERPLEAGENLRYRGEDFQAGSPIVSTGTLLQARHLAGLAATGTAEAEVYVMPTVAVLATGKEISDDYGQALADSAIYNSNAPYLTSELNAAGIHARYVGNIGDDPELFSRWLDELSHERILISSGAVSKGRWDFIPEVLQQKGAKILFHGVAIKPGKPVLFAVLPDGRYFFGLPGNPIASAVGLRFFVQPLLRALLGMEAEAFPRVRLNKPYTKKGDLRHFLKSLLGYTPEGDLRVTILDGQESFRIAPLLQTNAWSIVEEDQNALNPDETLSVAPAALFSTAFSAL